MTGIPPGGSRPTQDALFRTHAVDRQLRHITCYLTWLLHMCDARLRLRLRCTHSNAPCSFTHAYASAACGATRRAPCMLHACCTNSGATNHTLHGCAVRVSERRQLHGVAASRALTFTTGTGSALVARRTRTARRRQCPRRARMSCRTPHGKAAAIPAPSFVLATVARWPRGCPPVASWQNESASRLFPSFLPFWVARSIFIDPGLYLPIA
jgi:hypothetical protein